MGARVSVSALSCHILECASKHANPVPQTPYPDTFDQNPSPSAQRPHPRALNREPLALVREAPVAPSSDSRVRLQATICSKHLQQLPSSIQDLRTGSGFIVQGSGFNNQDPWFIVQGSGFSAKSSRLPVQKSRYGAALVRILGLALDGEHSLVLVLLADDGLYAEAWAAHERVVEARVLAVPAQRCA